MRFALLLALLVIGIPLVAFIAGREWSTPTTTRVAAIELYAVGDRSWTEAGRPSSQPQPVKRTEKAAVRQRPSKQVKNVKQVKKVKKVEKHRPAAAIISPAPIRAGSYDGDDDDGDDDD
jgi:hypothetical protein